MENTTNPPVRSLTSELTRRIRELQDTARASGDVDLVAMCELALDGDPRAIATCAGVLAYALGDDEPDFERTLGLAIQLFVPVIEDDDGDDIDPDVLETIANMGEPVGPMTEEEEAAVLAGIADIEATLALVEV